MAGSQIGMAADSAARAIMGYHNGFRTCCELEGKTRVVSYCFSQTEATKHSLNNQGVTGAAAGTVDHWCP